MKIVFNFKFIYMYALMHVACYFFLIISLIIYIFIIKIVFKFKCIHAFAWVTCVYATTHGIGSQIPYWTIKEFINSVSNKAITQKICS